MTGYVIGPHSLH